MWKKCKKALAIILATGVCAGSMIVQAAELSGKTSADTLSEGLILDFNMDSIDNGVITNSVDSRKFTVQGPQILTGDRDGTGKALQFDGKTNYINLGKDYQIPDNKATIAAWVKIDSSPNGLSRILCRSRTPVPNEHDLSLYVRNNGKLETQGVPSWLASDESVVNFGSWQHVAVTYDGTTQNLYVNGKVVKTAQNINETIDPNWQTVPLLVGAGWNTDGTAPFADHMFKGAMDDLKVYTRALSQDEIKKLSEMSGAEIQSPKNYQIIQRNEDGTASIPVSGVLLGEQTDDVMISLLDSEGKEIEEFDPVQATISDGMFEGELKQVPTGLYQVKVIGKANEKATFQYIISPVGIGDLWIIAGQSNAAGYGMYIPGEEVDSAADDPSMEGVHLYRWNTKSWSLAAQPIGEAQSASNHAPGLTFAKEISAAEKVPVGIIQVAVGGSGISNWLKGEVFYNRILDCFDSENRKAKGLFWYQGEADTFFTSDGSIPQDNVNAYAQRFTQMVKDLREDLNNPNLTVITAQLNSHADRDHRHPPAALWYQMKEIQRQLGDPESEIYVPNSAVISTSGLRLSDGIHNSANSNVIIAKRMAKAALALAYGEEVDWQQPSLSHGNMKDRTVLLTFNYANEGLKSNGKITDFTIRDDMGNVPIENAEIDGNHVRLTVNRDFSGTVKVDGLAAVKPTPTVFNQKDEPILAFYDITIKEVNFTSLIQLINKAEKLEKNSYTIGSWNTLQSALSEAKAAMNDEYMGQAELNLKAEALSESIQALVEIKDLNELYLSNKDKSNDNFTTSSWNDFQMALTEAEEILNNPNAVQKDVDESYDNLKSAIEKLKVNMIDKAGLSKLYQENKDKDNIGYTNSSWELFQDALTEAKEILDNPNAVQKDVDEAYDNLKSAIEKLEVNVIDKAGLSKLYQENKDKDNIGYTNSSWELFQDALTEAKEALENPNTDQEQVDKALYDLQLAINGLKLSNPESSATEQKEPEKNDQGPSTGDNFNFAMIALILVLAGAGFVCAWKKRKAYN